MWLIRYSDRVDRVAAAAIGLVTAVVLVTSTAIGRGPLAPGFARAAGGAYTLATAAIVVWPGERRLHRIALVLGTVFWGGRLAAFAAIVMIDSRPDLVGTVLERAFIVAAVAIYHSSGIIATPSER